MTARLRWLSGLVVFLLTAGCTTENDPPRTPTATPLSELDLTGVTVPRAPFCQSLEASVTTVLGGEPASTEHYGTGETVRLEPGLRDVAHEYGCTFSRGRTTARTWVFAQPATRADARRWLRETREEPGCRPAGELSFGDPGVVQSCTDQRGRRQLRTVRAVGLFGDAYLTCEVTVRGRRGGPVPARDVLEPAQRWCAEVARSAG